MNNGLGLLLVAVILVGFVAVDRWQESSGRNIADERWFPWFKWSALAILGIGLLGLLLLSLYRMTTL